MSSTEKPVTILAITEEQVSLIHAGLAFYRSHLKHHHELAKMQQVEELQQALVELAARSGPMYPMDVEALRKLAELNQLQQQSTGMDEHSTEFKELRTKFSLLYNWLHELNNYHIHKDSETGLWRLGTYLSRKSGGR